MREMREYFLYRNITLFVYLCFKGISLYFVNFDVIITICSFFFFSLFMHVLDMCYMLPFCNTYI